MYRQMHLDENPATLQQLPAPWFAPIPRHESPTGRSRKVTSCDSFWVAPPRKPEAELVTETQIWGGRSPIIQIHEDSNRCFYFLTGPWIWMVDFDGFHVGKYTSSMGSLWVHELWQIEVDGSIRKVEKHSEKKTCSKAVFETTNFIICSASINRKELGWCW